MGVFAFMSGRKKLTPGQVAKERLKVVLVQDRVKLNPELLELIRADLLAAISRRLEVDEQNVEISLAREERWDKLHANVPIKRQ
ncbi:MAG TPA: cell division topological specificity factor MinE, partial [Ktedonobacteraceae bacterium]|nr:cell division topological specificity factor MinE [Ktedonobacteraceae bacterium]